MSSITSTAKGESTKSSPWPHAGGYAPGATVIYSSERSSYFADAILSNLEHAGMHATIGAIERHVFSDGEKNLRLDISHEGALTGLNVVYVCSTDTDAAFMEMVRLGYYFSSAGVRRVVFVLPFFGYSTMERSTRPGEVVAAKAAAEILSAIPCSSAFLMLDLHSPGILHYFHGTHTAELGAAETLKDAVRSHLLNNLGCKEGFDNVVFGSADLGRPKVVQSWAREFCGGENIALVHKSRIMETVKLHHVIGEVEGKHVVIYDDMVRSGGTLIQAAKAYIDAGALSVQAVLTHLAVHNLETAERLMNSKIDKIIATNSHPLSQSDFVKENSDFFMVVDVSRGFAEQLERWLVPVPFRHEH